MEKIYEKLRQDGAKLIGSCKLPNAPLKEFPNLIYAISIAVKLSDSVLKTIVDRPTISYFQHYRTANARLDQLAFTCVSMIEDLGYNAFPIPASQSDNTQGQNYSGVFQHKTAARLSGLGYIGKNGLLITKEYGSKVRFATVLTDMPLNCETNILENDCKGCDLCVKACPGGAISGKIYSEGMKREEFFDAEKCSQNMKKYKDIGRGAVCGICISVCPKNKLNLHKN
jgi:epoxyqueuosine reductase QueG